MSKQEERAKKLNLIKLLNKYYQREHDWNKKIQDCISSGEKLNMPNYVKHLNNTQQSIMFLEEQL